MTYFDASLKKPCIALMGEFSAGKSTLANLLIGSQPLPVQVVASHVPPVMISYGTQDPFRVDLAGEEHPIDIAHIAAAPLEETSYIRIFFEEDVLKQCDLLDMPGISDPNMSPQVWQRMIARADGILWCSHATQAWRQSEAAVWESLPDTLHANSLLLLTRIDKMTSEKDREKVVRRVSAETESLFRACVPISLLQAANEQNDYEAWLRTGAGDFAKHFKDLLSDLNPSSSIQEEDRAEAAREALRVPLDPETALDMPRILPRRVRAATRAVTPRPQAG
jgi:GTPase Era involved in 16S rRNA processing